MYAAAFIILALYTLLARTSVCLPNALLSAHCVGATENARKNTQHNKSTALVENAKLKFCGT